MDIENMLLSCLKAVNIGSIFFISLLLLNKVYRRLSGSTDNINHKRRIYDI